MEVPRVTQEPEQTAEESLDPDDGRLIFPPEPRGVRKGEHSLDEELAGLSPERAYDVFLETRGEGITALQAYLSNRAVRPNMDQDEIEMFHDRVTRGSEGALTLYQGALCEISDGVWTRLHAGENFPRNPNLPREAIRGINFKFGTFNTVYECIVLQDGGSRSFYDDKTPEKKKDFLTAHAANAASRVDRTLYPYGYLAIAEFHQEDHSYHLLDVVPHPGTEGMQVFPIPENVNHPTIK